MVGKLKIIKVIAGAIHVGLAGVLIAITGISLLLYIFAIPIFVILAIYIVWNLV